MNSSGPDGGSLRGRCLCVACANRHYSSNQAMAPASQKEGKINESVQRQMESIPQVRQEFSGGGGTPCELTSKKSFDNPGFGAATLLPVQVRNVINFTADWLRFPQLGWESGPSAPYPTQLEFHVHVSLLEVINSSSCALQQLVSLLVVTEPEIHTFPARER